MRFTRFHFGVITTLLWLGAMFFVVRDPCRLLTMELNELGDFLAGFFAPLAFLWLVLGYLQQGEELQHSTKALQLQAEELRNSVEQQRKLVEVSRQQWESEREAAAFEQLKQAEAAKPYFQFTTSGGNLGNLKSIITINMKNLGSKVTEVSGHIQGAQNEIICVPIFETSKNIQIQSPLADLKNEKFLDISYVDAFQKVGSCRYRINIEDYCYPTFELVKEKHAT